MTARPHHRPYRRAEIEVLDVNVLTPRQSLDVLYRLKGLTRE